MSVLTLLQPVLTFLKGLSPLVWVILLLLVVILWQDRSRAKEHAQLVRTELASVNAAAQADSTHHEIVAGQQLAERAAVQQALVADSLDRSLKQTSAARDQLAVQIKAVTGAVAAPVQGSPDSTRHVNFLVNTAPLHLALSLEIPVTGPATLRYAAQLDPLPLGLRLACGTQGDVHRASVDVLTPSWARTRLVALQQTSDVCNPGLQQTIAPRISLKDRLGLTLTTGLDFRARQLVPIVGGLSLFFKRLVVTTGYAYDPQTRTGAPEVVVTAKVWP